MGVNNWKQKAQERKPWRGVTEQAKTHKELELRKKKNKNKIFWVPQYGTCFTSPSWRLPF